MRVCIGTKTVFIGGEPRFVQKNETDFGPMTMVNRVEPDEDPEVQLDLDDDPEVVLEEDAEVQLDPATGENLE